MDNNNQENIEESKESKGRCTKQEHDKRLNLFMELIVMELDRKEIKAFVSDQYNSWDLSEKQIDKYYRDAYKEFAKVAKVKRSRERGKMFRLYQKLLRDELRKDKPDTDTILRILAQKTGTFGLSDPTKTQSDINKKEKKIKEVRIKLIYPDREEIE